MLHLALKLTVWLEKREIVSLRGTNMHQEPWFMKAMGFHLNEQNKECLRTTVQSVLKPVPRVTHGDPLLWVFLVGNQDFR